MDGLKPTNDRYGHRAGDAAIHELAARLAMTARGSDTVARIGGDEFVVVCEQVDRDAALALGRRLQEAISAPLDIRGAPYALSASIGVALGHADADALVANADAAVYRAKAGGRNQVQMISTTRGLSATSGTDDRADGSGKGSLTEAPSVFRRAQISLSGGPPAGPARMLAEASAQLT